MNPVEVREQTLEALRKKKWPVNPNLPLLDVPSKIRPTLEVASRAIGLHAVVATGYGFPKDLATRWLKHQSCFDALSPYEQVFLTSSVQFDALLQAQPNSLLVFAWALGKLPSFDPLDECPNDLVDHYPDLQNNVSAQPWIATSTMRTIGEIFQLADVLYQAHSVAADDYLNGRKTSRAKLCFNLRERRRAIEWMMSDQDWDDVTLDT